MARPRIHADNAARQAAYRARTPSRAWTPAEMRQAANSLHTVLQFAASEVPELAECVGQNARETLAKTTEHFRRQYAEAGGNRFMKALCNL